MQQKIGNRTASLAYTNQPSVIPYLVGYRMVPGTWYQVPGTVPVVKNLATISPLNLFVVAFKVIVALAAVVVYYQVPVPGTR